MSLWLITLILTDSTHCMCSSECCEESLLPFQPKDSAVINCTRRKQWVKNRAFSPTCYTSYPWLMCTTSCKAYCTYCRYCSRKDLLCLARKKEDSFVNTGFDNWKKACKRFSQHNIWSMRVCILLYANKLLYTWSKISSSNAADSCVIIEVLALRGNGCQGSWWTPR